MGFKKPEDSTPDLPAPFSSSKILLIGDVMLDRYLYGDVKRISPEAPVPVTKINSEDSSIGAAANCARNITSLGDSVTLVSVVGDDAEGLTILEKIAEDSLITPYILKERCRISTVKTRFMSDNHQMLRADWEYGYDISDALQDRIIAIAADVIPAHDVVVLSDYDKGTLTPHVLKSIIAIAKTYSKPVIIDPKKTDWHVYAGATVVTPNLHEWFIAFGREYNPEFVRQKLVEYGVNNILVTRSKAGMTLVNKDGHEDIPAVAKHIIDVTGAGDTAVAVLALGMASGYSLLEAATLANKAAGIVVGKPKTATLTQQELFS